MKTLKSVRVLAASLGVLAIGAMASPAMAFDNVDWTWNKTITQNEHINVWIDLDVDTTGLVEVEKLQIFLGNVNAQSTVSNIYNYQDQDGHYDYIRYCYCYIPVWVDPSEYAPTELPIVRSIATAVGNNQTITSDVPVYLHDGQFVANSRYNYDYGDIGIMGSKQHPGFVGLDLGGLLNRETVSERELFYRRRRDFVSSSGRSIGLSPDRNDPVPVGKALPQAGYGRGWCSHENYAHKL